jgi:integrase
MANRVNLTPGYVLRAEKPTTGDRIIYWDENLPCFGLMVTKAGHKSFVVQYRAQGRSRRITIKAEEQGGLTVDKARRQAKVIIGAVIGGGDPLAERRTNEAAKGNTFEAIADEFLEREGARLRSVEQIRATLKRLVYPKLGSKQIGDIRRSDWIRLLDKIADECGPVMSDHVLAYVRRICNWHATRSDDFRSPIVRGMARTKPSKRRRQRTLTDDELRAVWKAADESQSVFGWLAQYLLLTATRRNEAARMKRSEVSGTDWTIPESRYKTDLELLIPLSPDAEAILAKVPKIGRAGFVFTIDGSTPIAGFSKFKREFDKKCGVEGWTLHDLRRTARSLMSRAGTPADHAEICLGHVLPGIRGTYDKYEYRDEKRRAFEALASLIDRIVNPQSNVVAFKDVGLPDADQAAAIVEQSA